MMVILSTMASGPTKHCLGFFQRHNAVNARYSHFSMGLMQNYCVRLSRVVFASYESKVSSSVESLSTTNYFDILGVEQTFIQSPSDLKAKYKTLMNKFHPDRHHALASAHSSDAEDESRSKTATMATDVTRAYSVLEDPLSRSLHLLELGGETISETDTSLVNNDLLVTIMAIREEIDGTSSDTELRPILQCCREQQDEICEKLALSFSKGRIKDAKYLTAELQFWKRIEETIIEKMQTVE